jgi:hypothetical protein
MVKQNCLPPNVLVSPSPSRGYVQTRKLFALVLFCLVLLLGSKEYTVAQVVGGDKYGKGTILEFKRFVNGEERHNFDPGEEIWVTAKAKYHNDREIEQVTFFLVGLIRINPEDQQNVYGEAVTAQNVDPGGKGNLILNKSGNGGYVTPVNNCPSTYYTAAVLGSSINDVTGDPLDLIAATFMKN